MSDASAGELCDEKSAPPLDAATAAAATIESASTPVALSSAAAAARDPACGIEITLAADADDEYPRPLPPLESIPALIRGPVPEPNRRRDWSPIAATRKHVPADATIATPQSQSQSTNEKAGAGVELAVTPSPRHFTRSLLPLFRQPSLSTVSVGGGYGLSPPQFVRSISLTVLPLTDPALISQSRYLSLPTTLQTLIDSYLSPREAGVMSQLNRGTRRRVTVANPHRRDNISRGRLKRRVLLARHKLRVALHAIHGFVLPLGTIIALFITTLLAAYTFDGRAGTTDDAAGWSRVWYPLWIALLANALGFVSVCIAYYYRGAALDEWDERGIEHHNRSTWTARDLWAGQWLWLIEPPLAPGDVLAPLPAPQPQIIQQPAFLLQQQLMAAGAGGGMPLPINPPLAALPAPAPVPVAAVPPPANANAQAVAAVPAPAPQPAPVAPAAVAAAFAALLQPPPPLPPQILGPVLQAALTAAKAFQPTVGPLPWILRLLMSGWRAHPASIPLVVTLVSLFVIPLLYAASPSETTASAATSPFHAPLPVVAVVWTLWTSIWIFVLRIRTYSRQIWALPVAYVRRGKRYDMYVLIVLAFFGGTLSLFLPPFIAVMFTSFGLSGTYQFVFFALNVTGLVLLELSCLTIATTVLKVSLSRSPDGGGMRSSSHCLITACLVAFSVLAFFCGTQLRSQPGYSVAVVDGTARVNMVVTPPLPPVGNSSSIPPSPNDPNATFFGWPAITKRDVTALTMDKSDGESSLRFAPAADRADYAWLVASSVLNFQPPAPPRRRDSSIGRDSFGCNVTEVFEAFSVLSGYYYAPDRIGNGRSFIRHARDPLTRSPVSASGKPFSLLISLVGGPGTCDLRRKIGIIQFWSVYYRRQIAPPIASIVVIDNRNYTAAAAIANAVSPTVNGTLIDDLPREEVVPVAIDELSAYFFEGRAIANSVYGYGIEPTGQMWWNTPLLPTVLLSPSVSRALNDTLTSHPNWNTQLMIGISTEFIPTIYASMTATRLLTPVMLILCLLLCSTFASAVETANRTIQQHDVQQRKIKTMKSVQQINNQP